MPNEAHLVEIPVPRYARVSKGELQRKCNLLSKCKLYRETSCCATFRPAVALVAEKTACYVRSMRQPTPL